jgi:hypothetical protein
MRKTIIGLAGALALLVGAPANANDGKGGTMDLMPDSRHVAAIEDEKLDSMRGGFAGIAFNVIFSAFVENGTLTGGGTSSTTTGGTGGLPPVNTTIANGQVTVQSFVGSLSNVSGVFNIVQTTGSYNVVNTNLTVQIAILNVLNSANTPTLQSIFGR